MPGATPNFAIPYPCSGDTIDPGVFEDFADAVEAALTTVAMAAEAARIRPRILVTGVGVAANGVTLNVPTTATPVTSTAASNNGTGITVTQAGVWMVSANFVTSGAVTNVVGNRGSIVGPGTQLYRRHLGLSTTPADGFQDINVSGLFLLAPADTLTPQYFWTGTGVNVSVSVQVSAALIARV